MKSILALGAGVVLALAPGGAAFADVAPHSTGQGKAYGNCQHSSAGGDHAPLPNSAGKGNGGHVVRGEPVPCVVAQAPAAPASGTSGDATGVGDDASYVAEEDATVG